jgi:hypothetical protein
MAELYETYFAANADGTETCYEVQASATDDATLVQVVEELGALVNVDGSELSLVALPVFWDLQEASGFEYVTSRRRIPWLRHTPSCS